ncbi:bifunctional nuclease family protein [Salidesulfovibrio onnuriiensis]|uniref:bifunctional nuclease family protein n=1 Tax=Salidesulfovibrio onnuriiensis TaxID=2583823 RepID=UPI0011C702C3|nr:bifunctional nuclease family protein [Salidesulfovibrio onnuriiensis]
MVRTKVFGMALDETNQAPILILKNEQEAMVLPIWIGAVEAMSITMALNKIPFPRPMTHDLLLSVINTLGGVINQVQVTDIEDGTFFAEMVVLQDGEELRIDCRPSDAIALAVRGDTPIFVNLDVLKTAGVSEDSLKQKVVRSEDSDKWKELLDSMDEDDAKYKM